MMQLFIGNRDTKFSNKFCEISLKRNDVYMNNVLK